VTCVAEPGPVVSRRGGERGSMAIELVGMLPLLIIVTILCIQVFLAAATAGAAQKAARDGARSDSLGRNGPAAARDSLPRWVGDSRIYQGSAAKRSCGATCYRVEVEVPLVVPGFSTSLVTISRTAEMRG
jgi:TadE-like protein